MPRPKNDPDAPPAPKTPEEAVEQGIIDVSDIPMDRPTDVTLETAIENANALLAQKRELLEKIGKVRELCTLLIESSIGDQEQVAWVRFYLPRKTRKNAEDEAEENGTDDVESVAEQVQSAE